MKASDVQLMFDAYKKASELVNYPLHLGVTEAGTERMGIIKSSAGIGALLIKGIGDTIRISLTADPVKEIYAAHDLLKALDIETEGIQFVSCPTCGRTDYNMLSIIEQLEPLIYKINKPLKIAIMGCVVNGPGEAREADVGIAGGRGEGLLFRNGQIIEKVPESELIPRLLAEIRAMDKQ